MNFFKDFPIVNYKFGDGEAPVLFNNLTVYIDLIDQVRGQVEFYEKYTIQDGERPDTVSQTLYGTPDYHWTFYLLNDKLRESGWPITNQEVYSVTEARYPNRTIVTKGNIASYYTPGTTVIGRTSGTFGKVVETNLDLGQIVVKANRTTDGRNLMNNFGVGEQITAGDTLTEQELSEVVVFRESTQSLAAHHYLDSANGEIVDLDPFTQTSRTSGAGIDFLVKVTELERQIAFNNDLQNISVIKPGAINKVVNEFKRLLNT